MPDDPPTDPPPADPTRPDPEDHRRPDGSIDWIAYRRALDAWEPDKELPARDAGGELGA